MPVPFGIGFRRVPASRAFSKQITPPAGGYRPEYKAPMPVFAVIICRGRIQKMNRRGATGEIREGPAGRNRKRRECWPAGTERLRGEKNGRLRTKKRRKSSQKGRMVNCRRSRGRSGRGAPKPRTEGEKGTFQRAEERCLAVCMPAW